MATATYLIGVGGNRRGAHGAPAAEVAAALAALGALGGGGVVASPIVASPPLGPSARAFANAAALVASDEPPSALLARLKAIEARFGRRPGRRWGARVIDLDILFWSGGTWASRDGGRRLTIPHPALRTREFVLAPLAAIAPAWRDPVSGLTVRQLAHRLTRRRPLA